jgi:hypothetical protein
MRAIILACLVGLLSACSTPSKPPPEPVVVTQEVRVPVTVYCVRASDLPPKPGTQGTPAYPDLNLRTSDPLDDKVRAFAVGREMRDQRLSTLEALIEGCVTRNGN